MLEGARSGRVLLLPCHAPASRGTPLASAFRRFLLLPMVAAAALGVVVLGFWPGSDSPNFHGHAAGHWIMAIPVLFVGLVLARLPEAHTTARRIA